MNKKNTAKLGLVVLVVVALLGGATAYASGSFRANAASGARNGDYLLGKRVLYKKLVCSKCPFNRKVLKSRKRAEIMLLELQSDRKYAGLISDKEQNAIKQYLTLRFR